VTNAPVTLHVDLIKSSRDPHTHNNHNDYNGEMGIKGLTGLISEHAPAAIQVLKFSRTGTRSPRAALTAVHQEHKINTLFGRKVAIDASMSIYQFLIAVRQQDGQLLQNDAGEVTRCAWIISSCIVGCSVALIVTLWDSFIGQYEWWRMASNLPTYSMGNHRS